jgi:ribonuclease HI
MLKKSFFYAVRKGRQPGIYSTWAECEVQVINFQNPVFKKFATKEEAEAFIGNSKTTKKEEAKSKGYSIFTDGGSRGNPGVAGCGAVLYKDSEKLASCYRFLGHQVSNNVAEYYGVIYGLGMASVHKAKRIKVFTDSSLVVNQMNGKWKILHPDMIKLNLRVQEFVKDFSSVKFEHIPRWKNNEADLLSNLAMDLGNNI